jgi:hypothetical protein
MIMSAKTPGTYPGLIALLMPEYMIRRVAYMYTGMSGASSQG